MSQISPNLGKLSQTGYPRTAPFHLIPQGSGLGAGGSGLDRRGRGDVLFLGVGVGVGGCGRGIWGPDLGVLLERVGRGYLKVGGELGGGVGVGRWVGVGILCGWALVSGKSRGIVVGFRSQMGFSGIERGQTVKN